MMVIRNKPADLSKENLIKAIEFLENNPGKSIIIPEEVILREGATARIIELWRTKNDHPKNNRLP
jgi:hypothetical protein